MKARLALQIQKAKAVHAVLMDVLDEGRVGSWLAVMNGNLDFLDNLEAAQKNALIARMAVALDGTATTREELQALLDPFLAQLADLQDAAADEEDVSYQPPVRENKPHTIQAALSQCASPVIEGANLTTFCLDTNKKLGLLRTNPGMASWTELKNKSGNPILMENITQGTFPLSGQRYALLGKDGSSVYYIEAKKNKEKVERKADIGLASISHQMALGVSNDIFTLQTRDEDTNNLHNIRFAEYRNKGQNETYEEIMVI